jgi:hypothetical protein
MKLKNPDLKERTFLIQFQDIISEFWNEIPRLKEIKDLKYVTDTEVFKNELFNQLWLEKTERINSYILTTDDKREEYIWGLLSFSKSPEKFTDLNNEIIKQQLEREKYSYITCLQIRDVLRWPNYWAELFSKSVSEILKEFHKFRWVVSKEKLLPYYKYFWFEPINTINNEDGLFILTCDEKSFKKRH